MIREVSRVKNRLSREACISPLKTEKRGVLSVQGDGDPYGVPLNHYYNEEDGKLYFHCGKRGHKLDALRRCDKVSFCLCDTGSRQDGDWALSFRSVIVFGRVSFAEDRQTIYDIAAKQKFTDDGAYIAGELGKSGPATCMVALVPEHITGKQIREA